MSYFRLMINLVSHQNFSLNSFATRISGKTLSRNGKGFIMTAAATNLLSPNSNKMSTAAATATAQSSLCGKQQIRNFSSLQSKQGLMAATPYYQRRNFSAKEITKNINLCSHQPKNVKWDPKTLRLEQPIDKPLVIMLSWLLAKKKHLFKYAKIYTEQGYDVLTVEITPWQLLWPPKGSQLVALDVLNFLENNKSYNPLILHGFSVGAYFWGECMVHMARDMKRYTPLLDRIAVQVWDSAADITEIPIGVPKSIFPKNPTLQKALRNYCLYHMKTFHEQATTHYIRSSQIFHSTLVKAPSLFFLSKNDPIGAENSNRSVCQDYESAGIKCTWKCWDHSPHVSHYMNHKDEYLEWLFKHLDANLIERISEKSRAKL